MIFSDKFSLMLNLFEVKNLDLANAIGVDRTMISKWRSNQRKPMANSEQMVRLSEYFAELFREEENAKLFASAFSLDEHYIFPNNKDMGKLLYDWFFDDEKNINDLVNILSVLGKNKSVIGHGQLLSTPILFFEGFEGLVSAGKYLQSYIGGNKKQRTVKICRDYRMNTYLYRNIDRLNLGSSFVQYAANEGHKIDYLMVMAEYNIPYCLETLPYLLDGWNRDNISLRYYDRDTTLANYFIIIDDEIIEYGSFSDNIDYSPIIAHITTNKNIIKLFSRSFDLISGLSNKVNLEKYSHF